MSNLITKGAFILKRKQCCFRSVALFPVCVFILHRVPTRTGKPGKMGRHFPVREKAGNFEQTGKIKEKSGKITQNNGKIRKFEINII